MPEKCIICFEFSDTHISCTEKHQICVGCIEQTILAQMSSSNLRNNKGMVPCPGENCKVKWGLSDMLQWKSIKTPDFFVLIARRLQEYIAAIDPQNPASNKATTTNETDDRLKSMRTIIIEQILNIKCPKCLAVFVDYDGCDALTCSCCGADFCSLCLKYSSSNQESHAHVLNAHGQVHGGLENFSKVHLESRTNNLVNHLAKEVPLQWIKPLLDFMYKDLADLGISANKVMLIFENKHNSNNQKVEETHVCHKCRAAVTTDKYDFERKMCPKCSWTFIYKCPRCRKWATTFKRKLVHELMCPDCYARDPEGYYCGLCRRPAGGENLVNWVHYNCYRSLGPNHNVTYDLKHRADQRERQLKSDLDNIREKARTLGYQ